MNDRFSPKIGIEYNTCMKKRLFVLAGLLLPVIVYAEPNQSWHFNYTNPADWILLAFLNIVQIIFDIIPVIILGICLFQKNSIKAQKIGLILSLALLFIHLPSVGLFFWSLTNSSTMSVWQVIPNPYMLFISVCTSLYFLKREIDRK